MLQEGTKLNDTYTLLEQLGSGGGGIVYKAYHERLQTYVVVKQIREHVKGILESRAEADILKNIKHTRLPRVYDFLEINGEIFTVMDYVPGQSMDKVLENEGHFQQKEVLKWALQLADALAYLHNQVPPVIHSDIKPANVMLTPERDICLIDFNVSLAFDKGMRTSAGISRGYSPPEQYQDFVSYSSHLPKPSLQNQATQVMGKADKTAVLPENFKAEKTEILSGEVSETPTANSRITSMVGRGVDERSDVYSLGATLYHFLTGQYPGTDFERIVPLRESGVEISEGFAIIIGKMMELEPEKRYQNGSEVLDAFHHIYELDSEYRAYYRSRKRKKLAIAALFASGMILTASGWTLMGREKEFSYYQIIEQANELIEASDYEQAGREIEAASALMPNRMEACEKEMLRLYSMGQYESAVRYGQDALHDPVYSETGKKGEEVRGNIFYILGNAYFEQENYRDAINCFAEAIERNQKNSLFFRDEAIALAKTGNPDQAQEALDTAIKLGLGEDSIYMVRGEISFARGDDDSALESMELAVRTAESQELKRRAVLLYARACRRLGDDWLEREITCLETAEREFSTQVSLHISEQLADAYARKGKSLGAAAGQNDYGRALEKFKTLYEQGYSTRQMMENIAVIYQQMDQLEMAADMLGQIAEKYPEDYRAYKRLAFLEADIQQKAANVDRDYQQMQEYYHQAKELYEKGGIDSDTEMQMLETMMQDLEDGGWL